MKSGGGRMPWSVVKRNQQFCVIRSDTNKTVLCHDTRKQATDHMSALYANEKKQAGQLAVATELLRGRPLLKTSMAPSIAELEIALAVAETNAPINEAEGNLEQASVEQRNAESFRQAIQLLKDGKSLSVGQRLEVKLLLKTYQKENPNHDERGRFTSGDGGSAIDTDEPKFITSVMRDLGDYSVHDISGGGREYRIVANDDSHSDKIRNALSNNFIDYAVWGEKPNLEFRVRTPK
jgi:hypothetical protein